jgi:hypothetical protein
MSTRRTELFTTVRTEGGLLPPSLLSRVAGPTAPWTDCGRSTTTSRPGSG